MTIITSSVNELSLITLPVIELSPIAEGVSKNGFPLPFTDAFTALDPRWLNTGWGVSGGAMVAAVTLGAELLVNGGMEAPYTSGIADNWSALSTATRAQETTIVQSGSSSQYLNGTGGVLQSSVMVAIGWYQLSAYMYLLSGQGRLLDTSAAFQIFSNAAIIGSWQQVIGTGLTTATNRGFAAQGNGASEWYVDTQSCKQVSRPSMLQLINAGRANLSASITPGTFADKTQLGAALCWDSATNPQNGVIGIYDRAINHVKMLKCVAGTWTTLVDVAVAYSPGAVVKVVQTGNTTFQVWYGGTQRGTDQTISDAGIINNQLCGIFSTYANSFDDFTLAVS